MLIVPPPMVSARGTSLINAIKNLALTTNIVTCIDAGDRNTYSGSGQDVFDLSGNGANFTLGDNNTVEATRDPTYVGTPGRQSSGEYFRNPDYTYRLGSAVTTFAKQLHKDNALFTFVGWWRFSQLDLTNGGTLIQTGSSAFPEGIGFGSTTTASGHPGKLAFEVLKAGPTVVLQLPTGLSCIAAAPTFYAISYNEATGAWIMEVNGTQESGTATYTSPGTVDPSTGVTVLGNCYPSGGYSSDVFNFAGWSRALSSTELLNIYNATKGKFGL